MRRERYFIACIFACLVLTNSAVRGATSAVGTAHVETDVAYRAGGDPLQALDLYLPAGHGFATIVFVHGGSLNSGDRKDAEYPALAAAFQSRGVAVAVINYRLFPKNPWPAPAQDVAAATAWVHANIAARGGDPQQLFLVGHSSGARLVELVATDSTYLHAAGISLRQIRGVVGMGSILHDREFETEAAQASPDRVAQAFATDPDLKMFGDAATYRDAWAGAHVHAGMPPILILVADAEREHPPCLATGEEFVAAARKCGAWARVEVLPGRTHMETIAKMRDANDPTLQRIVRFIGNPRDEK